MVWNNQFFYRHPSFFPLQNIMQFFANFIVRWPTYEDYNQCLQQQIGGPISSASGQAIHFIAQQGISKTFEEKYEPAIYLRGEISTRNENWHDFFNFCVWSIFPKTKIYLNSSQYHCLLQRKNTQRIERTLQENIGAQFDESGVIVVSSSRELLALIDGFQWLTLFYDHKEDLQNKLKFFIFGHGLYEKCLNPYLGLTAKGICFQVGDDFFQTELASQLTFLDKLTVEHLTKMTPSCVREALTPIPILGYPNWYADQNKQFYLNKHYFRGLKNNNPNA